MSRILSAYVNCSLGGMTTVYRTRAASDARTQFDHVFEVDRGGLGAYEGKSNVTARIVTAKRTRAYIEHLLNLFDYSELRITSMPKLLGDLSVPDSTRVIYEIHSPNPQIVQRELAELPQGKVDEIWVPSSWSKSMVEFLLPRRKHIPVKVMANLVDHESFSAEVGASYDLSGIRGIPVSWIGRLENTQKNYLDFLRTLRLLPNEYYGLVIYSYEVLPDRVEKFLGDAAVLGVLDRIRIYSDVPQTEVAEIHRGVRDAGGVFYSTALSESFGYAVLEAALCGCRVVSFDVGPVAQHESDLIELVPVGDLPAAAKAITDGDNS